MNMAVKYHTERVL